jgi:uncharacterized membrane protein
MMTLDRWLQQAVRGLSTESADTVRQEIQEHYDAAREAAVSEGFNPQQAELKAVQALGDPCVANSQYRKVLLTSSEAAVLRGSKTESRMICANNWVKWTMLSTPGTLLLLSAIFLAAHQFALSRGMLVFGALMATFFMPPFLPIYTVSRGRIYRAIKWIVLIGGVLVLFGMDSRNGLWLALSCFFPGFFTEWKRMMIRRKLPISKWPKQLYL